MFITVIRSTSFLASGTRQKASILLARDKGQVSPWSAPLYTEMVEQTLHVSMIKTR